MGEATDIMGTADGRRGRRPASDTEEFGEIDMRRRMKWLLPKHGTRFKKGVIETLVASLLLQTVGAAQVTVVNHFPANRGPGYRKPCPDAAGAVGPRHTAVLDDRAFVVQDKATRKVLQNDTQHEFWLKVLPAGTFSLHANDPRLLYHPMTQRWIAWVQGLDPQNGYLAVSASDDPTGAWRGAKMPIPPHNYGARIGFDRNGLYISVHNGNNDLKTAQTCYAIPMADVVAAGGPDLSHMQALRDLQIEAFPATDLDPDKPPDAPAVLLNREFGNTASKLYLYRITWAGKTASISRAQIIPLSRTYLSAALQLQAVQPAPGLKLRADEGRRTLSAFARGGSVFGCNSAKRTSDGRCGILWYEVRIIDGALLQEGFVEAPDCDYLVPTLAVDGQGNIGLGCTRTSATEYPSVYVMMHAAKDAPGTMHAPVLAVRGTTYFRSPGIPTLRNAMAWGNYTSTCIDPLDPTLLWTCQEYAGSTVERQWCTAWAAFRLGAYKKSP
jgi:hypothetical protein